jgi:Ca-activated chloride channel homolog
VTFGWPIALVALVLLPLLVLLYLWSERRRERSQAAFGNPDLLPNVIDRAPGRLRYLPIAILLFGLAAMIVGVARPHATVSVPREEATVILAMDVSRSMKAKDVEPTRLDAARAAAEGFLVQVPEKFRVGVVSFATRAAVGVPPTHDRSLVEAALDSLAPGEGTAIGDAVALSIRVGQPEEQQDEREEGTGTGDEEEDVIPRAIVLISDGAQDGGSVEPAKAAEEAKERGIPVHTVLVGTPDGVVEERLTGGFERIIRVPPSPETLQMLAEATGGQFFTALDDERLREVYEELGSRLGEREESREITDVFAGAASVLLLLGGALSAFLFRRTP